jgi:O-antigen/teichoic acid export membrane protein|tara:strand:- start:5555 stop:7066 length:1512 start_codon:yes stop_codon:yes gene_type:complete
VSLGVRALIGSGWLAIGTLMSRFVGIFSTVILARLLTPADFGLLALMVSINEIVTLLFAFGPGNYLIRQKEIDERNYHTAFTFNIARTTIIAAMILAIAAPAAAFLDNPKIEPVLYVGAIGAFVSGLTNPGMFMYSKMMNFAPQAKLNFLASLVSIGVTLSLAFLWRDYWALVIGSVMQPISYTAMSYAAHRFRPRLSLHNMRDMFGFSMWVTIGNGLFTLGSKLDAFVLQKMTNTTNVGLFSTAKDFCAAPTMMLMNIANQVVYSTLSSLGDDKVKEKFIYLEIVGFLFLLIAPVLVGLSMTAPEVITILYGEKWLAMIPIVATLPLLQTFQLISNNVVSTVMKDGRTKLLLYRGISYAVIRIPAFAFGAYQAGLAGALIGYVAAGVMLTVIDLYFVRKVLPITAMDYISRLWRPVLALVVMYLGGEILRSSVDAWGVDSDGARLAIIVGWGVIVYPSVILLAWLVTGRPFGAEQRVVNVVGKSSRRLRKGLVRFKMIKGSA